MTPTSSPMRSRPAAPSGSCRRTRSVPRQSRRSLLPHVEEREDCEHASVTLVAYGQVELCEDAADVLLDGTVGDDEPSCDPPVGAALGHATADLKFTRG